MKKYLPYFLLLLLCGCRGSDNTETITIDKFPISKRLKGEFLILDTTPSCPNKITLIDTLVILKNMKWSCDNAYFYVYHRDDLSFLGSFGNEGRGPEEFTNPKLSGQAELNDKMIGIWIYNPVDRELRLINIGESCRQSNTKTVQTITAPSDAGAPLSIFHLKNNELVGTSISRNGRLFYQRGDKNTIEWVQYAPSVKRAPFDPDQLHNLYSNTTRIKPDGTRIVAALQLFKRIDIFDSKTNLLLTIAFEDSPEDPEFFTNSENPVPDDLMIYYTDLYLTDNYIYALNSNVTQKIASAEINNDLSEIHVFSWEGAPTALYKLDRFIGSFVVDEKNQAILGITIPEDKTNNQLVKFNLSK